MSRNCPDCTLPLESRVYKGMTLDVCLPCRGVWFDQRELAASLRGTGGKRTGFSLHFDGSVLKPGDEPRGACPRCVGKILQNAAWKNVAAGTCPACKGIWISGDSFDRLRSRLASEVPVSAPVRTESPFEPGSDLFLVVEEIPAMLDLFT